MIAATLDDINYDRARAAYRNTSFSSDRRAEQVQIEYLSVATTAHAHLLSAATNEAQHAAFVVEWEQYKTGLVLKYHAWLHAMSRCASSMITGPANFNIRRNEKANATERKRLDELLYYIEKGTKAAHKRIASAGVTPVERATSGEPVTILASGDGWQIVENPQLDRIQIVLDGKPDEATRAKLKGAAWNWSPTNNAWQRKRTPNAVYSAKNIMAVVGLPKLGQV